MARIVSKAHLAKNGCSETSDDAAAQADRELGAAAQVAARLLRHVPEREFVAELVHRELTNRVRNLSAHDHNAQSAFRVPHSPSWQTENKQKHGKHVLAQDRQEAGVEAPQALLACDAREACDETRREITFRDEAYAGRLEGRKEDISKEPKTHGTSACVHAMAERRKTRNGDALRHARGAEVYCGAVLHGGFLVAGDLSKLLLPELVASELGTALHEVANGCGSKTCEETRGSFGGYDMPRAREEVEFLVGWVYLDACLDDVNSYNDIRK